MPADEPKEFRARARKKLDEARAELGTLELEAPPGATLRVTGGAGRREEPRGLRGAGLL
jgi:hypothetical protein